MPSPSIDPKQALNMLLKDPYLYVIGVFAWLSVDLLKAQEKSITWIIGICLLFFSSTLLLIRFTVSLYRDYIDNFFKTHYQTLLDERARQVSELTELLSTKTTTETMGQQLVQQSISKTLSGTSYELDAPEQETEGA